MRDFFTDPIGVLITVLLVVSVVSLIVVGVKRDKWLREHCYKIGEMSSSVGVGSSSNGSATVITPGKTGYQCDDGKQYWE